jgi:hypothetical protein
MPPDLTDAEAAELYFRRGLTLLWGQPITTPAVRDGARLLRALSAYLAHRPPRWQGTVLLAWGRDGQVRYSHTGPGWTEDTRAAG